MQGVTKFVRNYWPTWLGVALVTAGVVLVVVGPKNPPWGGLVLGAGIALLGYALFRLPLWDRRALEVGGNVLLRTLAVLVILGLVNFLAAQYPAKVDVSANQRFTLAPESERLMQNLKAPVRVIIFDQQINQAARQLLENYRRASQGQLTYEVIDPRRNPVLAQQFGVQGFGEVYLESGQRRERLREQLNESNLSNAIFRLTQPNQGKVVFIQGHGERSLEPVQPGQRAGFSQAKQVLQARNFEVQPLNLTETPQIPQGTKVVVVAGPQQPFLEPEVKALQTFVQQGGGLLLLLDPLEPERNDRGLGPLLQQVGVKLDGRIIVSQTEIIQGAGRGVAVTTRYADHPITRDFGQSLALFPIAQPVDLVGEGEKNGVPLFLTGRGIWAERNTREEPFFDPQQDREGPLPVGVAVTKGKGRLVVIGDSDFAGDGLFNLQRNGDIFLNSVSWLAGQDNQPLSIRPKDPTNRRLNISRPLATSVSLLALVGLPGGALVTAAVVWWRRR
ncbi:MAG: Gldg family protein [Gloeomargarita sp. SKYG116]|nr:Gldg family protein [Gloeomargarita sp. SKYG116]MDW8400407.1 Gldg family protein [Gloeomargarita sp. SKYGB_i_bin116]